MNNLILSNLQIVPAAKGDKNCPKCHGRGTIFTVGIGEYDEWVDSRPCECIKKKKKEK